jgi:hypothetical protein
LELRRSGMFSNGVSNEPDTTQWVVDGEQQ